MTSSTGQYQRYIPYEMRPHCGNGGSSKMRTTNERGATAHASTTAPAAMLATRNPPLKANVEYSDVVIQSAAVPAAPITPRNPADTLNQRRWLPSRHSVSPMEMAAPTRSAWARQSVP